MVIPVPPTIARRGACAALLVFTLAAAAACSSDDGAPPVDQSGTVGGRVMLTLDGPLIGAQVSIDNLLYTAATPVVREHIADLTTDADGYFEAPVGTASGYFLITARGGQFTDYATGTRVVLDPADELKTILYTDLLEDLTTGMVTPVSHLAHALIVARTSAGLDASLVDAHAFANEHIDRHFGDLHWERVQPASLATAQPSPTDAVRAAFVLGAWSQVAAEIAAAAGASVQEVNPHTLAVDLATDLATGPFDGDDGNDRTAGSGLQLATCPPVDPTCVVPTGACPQGGACRTRCDAYAGTLRATLASEITALINDNGPGGRNQTGLSVADALGFARTMNLNGDAVLFGTACVEALDSVPPIVTWGDEPDEGDVVRGSVTVTVSATDDTGGLPVVTWEDGLVDTDGAANGAATTIDTVTRLDGDLTVAVSAIDATGNVTRATRRIAIDNTAPVVTVVSAGFVVDGGTWWSGLASPHLTGTVADDHGPVLVQAFVLGVPIASGTFASGAWALDLPGGGIAAAGSTVVVRAVDVVGNTTIDGAATSPFVRVDAAPPTVASIATTFYNESLDTITFPGSVAMHTHAPGAVGTLGGPSAACALVKKHAYLTATTQMGGGESIANPLSFKIAMADTGIGLDLVTLTYSVTSPSGVVTARFPLTATPIIGAPGSYDAIATLRRDGAQAVPAIGAVGSVEESTGPTGARTVFTVTFEVKDRLGHAAQLAPCFDYSPLGPPVQVVQTAREAVAGVALTPLKGAYDLPNGPTSAILNGTASAGILELWVRNPTGDPAYLTISAPLPPAPTYTKRVTTYLRPTTQTTVSAPSCVLQPDWGDPVIGGAPLCYGNAPAPIADAVVATSTPVTGWTPRIAVYDVTSGNVTGAAVTACAGCAANEWDVPALQRRAIVIGVQGVTDLRPDVAGPYTEVDGDFTGAVAPGAPTVQACIAWTLTGTAANSSQRCTRVQNFRQYRTLQQASVTLAAIAGQSMSADWSSAVAANVVSSTPAATMSAIAERRIPGTYLWTTTEN